MGLGPCSLSLGELHPDAGVLLLLGEESEGGEEGGTVRGQAVASSQAGGLCLLLSSRKGRKMEATASLQGLWTLFLRHLSWAGVSSTDRAGAAFHPQLTPWQVCRTPLHNHPG